MAQKTLKPENKVLTSAENGAADGIHLCNKKLTTCENCVYGKIPKKPFGPNYKRATCNLEPVHTDICQVNVPWIRNSRYCVALVDDYGRKIFVYFLESNDEVTKGFANFIKGVENESGCKLKTLKSANSGE